MSVPSDKDLDAIGELGRDLFDQALVKLRALGLKAELAEGAAVTACCLAFCNSVANAIGPAATQQRYAEGVTRAMQSVAELMPAVMASKKGPLSRTSKGSVN